MLNIHPHFRSCLGYFFLVVLLILIPYRSWYPLKTNEKSPASDSRLNKTTENISLKTFSFQSRFFIGAANYLKPLPYSESSSAKDTFSETWKKQFVDVWLAPASRSNLFMGQDLHSPAMLRRRYIMAQHLGLSSLAGEIIRTLRTDFPEEPQPNKKLDRLLEQVYPLNSAASSLLRPEEIELLKKRLDWFGEVAAADLAHHKGIQAFPHSPAFQIALAAYQTGTRAMIGLGLLLFLSLVSIVLILVLFGSRNTFGCFSAGLIPGIYWLEIFCLYLAAGHLGHFIINFFQNLLFPESLLFKLIGNILFISLIPLLILWPALFGIPLSNIRRSLGLHGDNLRKSLKDFFAGLTGFLAAWPFLYLTLMLSAYIFSWLKIDMAKGIHPIAPVLMEAHSPGMITVIFILGILVAPIVEEIMFRGVLYSWLRRRLNLTGAVIISAMIFALVHPQGLIGFMPIAFLGAVLALLREWRHNLLAPIIAHAGFNLVSLIIIRLVLGD